MNRQIGTKQLVSRKWNFNIREHKFQDKKYFQRIKVIFQMTRGTNYQVNNYQC